MLARFVCDRLPQRLGQPFVVDNVRHRGGRDRSINQYLYSNAGRDSERLRDGAAGTRRPNG